MGKGTLVLYIPPKPPPLRIKDKVEYRWSFDTEEGRREQGQCLATGMSFNEREKNLFAGHLFRDFLSSRA